MATTFTINGKQHSVNADPDTPLLWVIRDELNLTGTKFGCGMSLCGACTVHVDGKATRSCTTPLSTVQNKQVTTIEGLSSPTAKAITDAWQDLAVVQCGYCQSGQIMSATALLNENPSPTDEDINAFMSGNICRCATYHRIRKAVKQAADQLPAVAAKHAKQRPSKLAGEQTQFINAGQEG